MQSFYNISRVFRTAFRAALWLTICLVGLSLIALALFNFVPPLQNWVAQQVVNGLRSKLNTEVTLRDVDVTWFNSVRIEGLYIEDQQGDTLLYSDDFKINFKLLQLLRKSVVVSKIESRGGYAHLKRHRDSTYNFGFVVDALAPEKRNAASESDWTVALNSIAISDTRIRYDDDLRSQRMDLSVPSGQVRFRKVDQQKKIVDIRKVALDGVAFGLEMGERPGDTASTPAEQIVQVIMEDLPRMNPNGWRLNIGEVVVNGGRLNLDRPGQPPGPSGSVDFKHLAVSEINLSIRDVQLEEDTLTCKIRELSLREKSGFEVRSLEGDVHFSPVGTTLTDFHLHTPYSDLHDSLALNYHGLDAFRDVQNKVSVYFDARNSVLSSTDIRYLAPTSPYAAGENLRISGVISGKLSTLRGKRLVIDYGRYTHFVGSIYTDGLPIVDETYIELTIDTLITTRDELMAIVPKLNLPPATGKLGVMRFSGSFNGFIKDFVAYGQLNSALGSVKSDINMKFSEQNVPSYSGNLTLTDFDLGTWLDESPMLGRITMTGTVHEGVGFGKDLAMDVTGDVKSMGFNNYVYRNIEVTGEIKQRFFQGRLRVNDPNLGMDFAGRVDFKQRQPVFDLKAEIGHSDLQTLKFTKDYIALETSIDFNFTGIHPDSITGTAVLTESVVATATDTFAVDSVGLESVVTSAGRELHLTSPIAEAHMEGQFQFASLPIATMQFVNRYYAFFPDTLKPVPPQSVTFEVTIKQNHELLGIVHPALARLEGAKAAGSFVSKSNTLSLTTNIPEFATGKLSFRHASITVYPEGTALVITGSIQRAELSNSFVFTDTELKASLQDGIASVGLKSGQDALIKNVELTGKGTTDADSLMLSFTGSSFSLHDQQWTMGGKSELRVDRGGLNLTDFEMMHGGQKVELNTSRDGRHLLANLDKVDIQDFLQTFGYTRYELEGIVNGKVRIGDYRSRAVFVLGDLVGSELVFEGYELGTFDAEATYDVLNETFAVDGDLNKQGVRLAYLSGTYSHARAREEVNMDLVLNATPVVVFQPFLKDIFSEMHGTATAKVKMSGTPEHLVMTGRGDISNGAVKVGYLGTTYTFDKLGIAFTEGRIDVDDGMVYDKNGKAAVVTGGLAYTNFEDMGFRNFHIATTDNKFLLLETTAADNPDFYGTGYGRAWMDLNGPFRKLDMEVSAEPSKGTKLSLPIVSGTGYRRNNFVTFRTPPGQQVQKGYRATTSALDLTLVIRATPDAEMEIIFDERAGDIISGNGSGIITLTLSRSGEIEMHGEYRIEEGEYRFTLRDVVNKSFTITPGSIVDFKGDPYEAEMKVDAYYRTNAVPYDLFGDEEAARLGLTPEEISELKHSIDIDVTLKLKGTLDDPSLVFGLRPVGGTTGRLGPFEAKLREIRNDTTELYKQAFALLVLKQFVPESFAAEGGTGQGAGATIGAGASRNVTEFITSQLSRYFNDWLTKYNAQLDFSYASYDANDPGDPGKSYARNELDVELQKKLGRLTLDVGGTFEFGTSGPPQNTFAGDFRAEYSIKPDGRIKLVGFRQSDYDAFSTSPTGTVYKTGGGIFFRKEFDTWEEFFKSSKKQEPD